MPNFSKLDLYISGAKGKECQKAIDKATERLTQALSPKVLDLLKGTEVIIGKNIINSGAQTFAEEKRIILDSDKNALTLQEAEDYLVSVDVLRRGDWVKTLPLEKDTKWSCLTYQLVHEVGHVIDGLTKQGNPYHRLAVEYSPTKYGEVSETEAFAEALTYTVFGITIDEHAKSVVDPII